MRVKILVCCLVLLLSVFAFAESPGGKARQKTATALSSEVWIDANKLLMFVTNTGQFANQKANTFGKSDGLYFPFSSVEDIESGVADNTVIFAAGPWIGGIDSATGETLTVISEFSDEYYPGPMVDTGGGNWSYIDGADVAPEYRVYRLDKDSISFYKDNDSGLTLADYDEYQAYLEDAVPQGAPVYPAGHEQEGEPMILGDQFLWSVYNDANPEVKDNTASSTAPLGIEIRDATFAFDREDVLGQVIFKRLRIYNRGRRTLDGFYVCLWADPDLGGASDDLVGCDTILDLGYCYNATNNDNDYGSRPPCVAFDFFQGPLVFTGDDADTAKMWGQKWPQHRNMGMTAFAKYINGQEPQNAIQSYLFMTGIDGSKGLPYANGTKYYAPGNPVTNEGDLDFAPDDRRFMQVTGPITFRPGDSTEIVAAIVVAQGADRLSSIDAMKYFDEGAQEAFDDDFVVLQPPVPPVVTLQELDRAISFQWTDTSEVDTGDYVFEGYTVLQGESMAGPWKRVANFDLINDLTVIQELTFDTDVGLALVKPTKFGSDNGIRHYYGTESDAIGGGLLNNITDYFFRVEAYSHIIVIDSLTGEEQSRTLTSATAFKATPQQPPAGGTEPFSFDDIVPVTHTTGGSDGIVAPVVINPEALNGHTYRVTFEDTIGVRVDTIITQNPLDPNLYDTTIVSVDIAWHLDDLSIDTVPVRILAYQTNQSGDEDYEIVDGMKIKVSGPAVPGVKSEDIFDTDDESRWGWDIPNGERRFTWANADGFQWEGFRGAIGWGGPGSTRGYGIYDPVAPGNLVRVLLRLATVDEDGIFDPADENVSYAYRYIRGKANAPAQPEFAPHYTQGGTSYDFEDFQPSCPLSAWNIDVDPPQRLAVGYLENNAAFAVLDGEWWPRESDDYDDSVFVDNGVDATSANGPREWLWIYLAPYSETPVPEYQLNAIDDPMPIMYWLTVNRRGSDVPFSPGGTGEDEFLIIPGKINTVADTFTFVATEQTLATSGDESALDRIRAVPNPYYLASSYDKSTLNRVIKFTNLPVDGTIRIFTLGGALVATVPRDHPDQSYEEWDVESENGIPVASGIYIYVVESPGFGTKIGKMAVFTEEEQLNTY
jgi:hypothetical protein